MKKIIILILLASNYCYAQIQKPVKWSYAAKKLSATEAMLFARADIDNGWHIYSVNQKEGGPQKTSFTFSKDKSYVLVGKVTEPKPIKKFEDVFGIEVWYFNKPVTFSQRIKLNTKLPFVVKGKVEFMACTDEQCLPPDVVEFAIPIK